MVLTNELYPDYPHAPRLYRGSKDRGGISWEQAVFPRTRTYSPKWEVPRITRKYKIVQLIPCFLVILYAYLIVSVKSKVHVLAIQDVLLAFIQY